MNHGLSRFIALAKQPLMVYPGILIEREGKLPDPGSGSRKLQRRESRMPRTAEFSITFRVQEHPFELRMTAIYLRT
jgi:hypothetical protein